MRLILLVCLWIASAAFADDAAFGPRLVQEDIRIPAGNGRYTIAATHPAARRRRPATARSC